MNILNLKHQKYINLTKSLFSSIYQPFFPNVPFFPFDLPEKIRKPLVF